MVGPTSLKDFLRVEIFLEFGERVRIRLLLGLGLALAIQL